MADEPLACAGKSFEHHQQIVMALPTVDRPWLAGADQWECTACGTRASFRDATARFGALASNAKHLGALWGAEAVVLLPSDSPPGLIGRIYGCEMYRVQGIDKPMVAIPGA